MKPRHEVFVCYWCQEGKHEWCRSHTRISFCECVECTVSEPILLYMAWFLPYEVNNGY